MSYIRIERQAMREEFEREYGIKLREDDELLPIIHFISKSCNLIVDNNAESRRVLDDMKQEARQILSESSGQINWTLEQTQRITVESAKLSKTLFENYGLELKKLKQAIHEVQRSIQAIPNIPPQVKVNTVWSFETVTMKFLWRYFLFSFPLALIGFLLAGHFFYEVKEIREKYRPNQIDWLYQFYKETKLNSPKTVKTYEDKNPIPSN